MGAAIMRMMIKNHMRDNRCRAVAARRQLQSDRKRGVGTLKRYKKKELLESVSTLMKANDTIVKSIQADPGGVAEVLAACQESAILIGNYIESLDEKYAYLVRLLEDYCENIFQMSEAVPDEIQCRKIAKKIRKQLNQLRHGITYDLPGDRKEVVFLPYKASMWDSLESVWKAADADENCDAYVIPIPYFDKNSDGSFHEMHYEGDQYPPYVPVTDYKEYNLAEQRPDEIYIHSPYDQCNFVTSVHPDFYARNLKKYTDKLVYIPYFVLGEINPDDQAAIDGMKHFVFLPGVIYADKVIVQSEDMRQIYINEYMKAAKANGLSNEHTDRKKLEEKFLGLGSPKVDKVLNTKKEDLEIPGDWLKIIEKPDGNWKKVIFYNTSIAALLQHNEKMLAKIEDVFKTFRENRNEVALLWRPHPLIENTLTSMRPQLWERYKAVRDRYIGEGWGIYDDTADMDRAVALSDAYYGDGSSIVQLYQGIGKPLLIQNVDILEKNRKDKYIPKFVVSAVYKNKVWFPAINYNGIFSFDNTSGKVELETKLRGELTVMDHLVGKPVCYEDYLVWAPIHAKGIWAMNLNEKELLLIDGSEVQACLNGMIKFSKILIYANKLYLFPGAAKEIIEIDMDRKKAFSYLKLEEEYKKVFGTGYQYLSDSGWHEYEGKIYFALSEKPCMVFIDMKTKVFDVVQGWQESCGIQVLFGVGNNIYIVMADGHVALWDINLQAIRWKMKVADHLKDVEELTEAFLYDDCIFFVSSKKNIGIKIERKNDKAYWFTYESEWQLEKEAGQDLRFSSFNESGKLILLGNEIMVCIDLPKKEVSCKKLSYPIGKIENYFREESKKVMSEPGIFHEDNYCKNVKFLCCQEKRNLTDRASECGRLIYSSC